MFRECIGRGITNQELRDSIESQTKPLDFIKGLGDKMVEEGKLASTFNNNGASKYNLKASRHTADPTIQLKNHWKLWTSRPWNHLKTSTKMVPKSVHNREQCGLGAPNSSEKYYKTNEKQHFSSNSSRPNSTQTRHKLEGPFRRQVAPRSAMGRSTTLLLDEFCQKKVAPRINFRLYENPRGGGQTSYLWG